MAGILVAPSVSERLGPGGASRGVWLLPPAVTLVLGGYLIFVRAYGLWYDEFFSTEVARLPLDVIVRAAWEGHGTTWYLRDIPPSYNLPWYLLAHVWLQLPGTDNDWSLRLLSLLAAAGGTGVLAMAVARLARSRGVGVLAGVAVAASPLFLEWVSEARPYGCAVLAVSLTVLGLARWLDRAPGGLALVGVAATLAGLAHWYALLAVAGVLVAGLALAPRRSLPLVAIGVLAALPTAGLVALNLSTVGDRNAALLYDTEGRLPLFAAWQWSGTSVVQAVVVAVLGVIGAARGPARLRVVATCWATVPVVLLLGVESYFRPIYEPRYVLPALLGLGVLTAAGAFFAVASRRVALVLSLVLVGSSLIASSALIGAPKRERADEVVALIAERHRPGDAVVAGDRQSALGLEHYTRTRYPQLAPDLLVPPVLAAPTSPEVWYVRVRIIHGETGPVDGDVLLAASGMRVAEQWFLKGEWTSLVVTRWVR